LDRLVRVSWNNQNQIIRLARSLTYKNNHGTAEWVTAQAGCRWFESNLS